MIARTELLRAVGRRLPERLLEPLKLRALDALHVAGAIRLHHGLEAVVTYDRRMMQAAGAAALPVASPGDVAE